MDQGQQMKAQIFEMEMYSDMFAKMQGLCWRKCIAHTNDVRCAASCSLPQPRYFTVAALWYSDESFEMLTR